MARRFAAAQLDALSPENVQDFKHESQTPDPDLAGGGLIGEQIGPIVAQGDSWFNYSIAGTDVIDNLRYFHNCRIRNFGTAGDTLENMIYGARTRGGEYEPVPGEMREVVQYVREKQPRVFLFSGGGNDVAGDEFGQFLNHRDSGLPAVRASHADFMIHNVFRSAYSRMIREITAAAPNVRIFAHGYGYPHADGRGVGRLFGFTFVGPWLRPALAARRIAPAAEGRQAVRDLIDRFNGMLQSLEQQHANFHYVNLRPVIGEEIVAWANELHVRNSVYRRIADEFAVRIGDELGL